MLPKAKALNSKMIIAELDQIISQPAKCQLQSPPFDAKGFCFAR